MTTSEIPHAAKVITVSDGVYHGTRVDTGGSSVADYLAGQGFTVVESTVIPDGDDSVAGALVAACDGFAGLVVTTGGPVSGHAIRRLREQRRFWNVTRRDWRRPCVPSAHSAGCLVGERARGGHAWC